MARTAAWTFPRDAQRGLNFTAPNSCRGQGVLVKADAGITSAKQLDGATVCFGPASTHELNLADWSRTQCVRPTPVIFADKDGARRAYEANRCDSHTGDDSQPAAVRAAFPDPKAHARLPERISPAVPRLLGRTGELGPAVWLDRAWTRESARQRTACSGVPKQMFGTPLQATAAKPATGTWARTARCNCRAT